MKKRGEPTFQLQFFNFELNENDEFVNEENVTEGWFYTLNECYDRIHNIGSRWIFYPHVRILRRERIIEEHICWECVPVENLA